MKHISIILMFLTTSLLAGQSRPQALEPAYRSLSTKKGGLNLIDDRTFLRRAWLDITGTLPQRPRVDAFLANSDPDKYAQEIDSLLASEAFTDRWTTFFADLLQVRTLFFEDPVYRNVFYNRLREMTRSNTPLDEMIRNILTGSGFGPDPEASMLFWVGEALEGGLRLDYLDDQAAWVSDTLLGVQTRCISCHDGQYHLENVNVGLSKMTRQQFWGLSALMASTHFYVSYQSFENMEGNDDFEFFRILEIVDVDHSSFNRQLGEIILFDDFDYLEYPDYLTDGQYHAQSSAGQGMRPPRTGGVIPPVYPFSGKGPKPGETRRQALARELTADPQFARNFVNRIWAHFFGSGFVEPLNGWDLARLDPSVAASNNTTVQAREPQLLAYLTHWFQEHDFDVRGLVRLIANSRLYQFNYQDYAPNDDFNSGNPDWAVFRNSTRVRRVDAETIVDVMSDVLGLQPRYLAAGYGDHLFTSAWQLPSPNEPAYEAVFDRDGELRFDPRTLGFFSGDELFYYMESAKEIMRQFGRGDYINSVPRKNENTVQNALVMMNGWMNFWLDEWEFHPGIVSRVNALEQGQYTREEMIERLYQDILFRDPTSRELAIVLNHGQTKEDAQLITDLMWALFNHPDFLHR